MTRPWPDMEAALALWKSAAARSATPLKDKYKAAFNVCLEAEKAANAGADMTRPYPVSVAIREHIHRWIGPCGQVHNKPEGSHTEFCDGLHDGFLHIMQQWPGRLPGGPPIRHQPDPMND